MNCVVCYEEAPLGLACSSGHVTCDSCLAPYMGEKAAALAKTNLLAAQFDAAESTGDAANPLRTRAGLQERDEPIALLDVDSVTGESAIP